MRDFNRGNRQGGGGGRFNRGGFRGRDSGGRDSGRREMHSAVCDECGNRCEVPFKPSGDKPIYCSDCFERKNDGGSGRPRRENRGSRGNDFGKKDDTNKKLLEQMSSLNSKLDRIIGILESNNKEKSDAKMPVAKKAVVKKTEVEKKADETPVEVEKAEAKKPRKKAVTKSTKKE